MFALGLRLLFVSRACQAWPLSVRRHFQASGDPQDTPKSSRPHSTHRTPHAARRTPHRACISPIDAPARPDAPAAG